MRIRRPLGKLDVCHHFGTHPCAVFHLFLRQGPLRAFAFRQIRKWTGGDFSTPELGCYRTAGVRNKAVSHLARVQQCGVLIVPDNDGIDGVSRNIAANYEFLASP